MCESMPSHTPLSIGRGEFIRCIRCTCHSSGLWDSVRTKQWGACFTTRCILKKKMAFTCHLLTLISSRDVCYALFLSVWSINRNGYLAIEISECELWQLQLGTDPHFWSLACRWGACTCCIRHFLRIKMFMQLIVRSTATPTGWLLDVLFEGLAFN